MAIAVPVSGRALPPHETLYDAGEYRSENQGHCVKSQAVTVYRTLDRPVSGDRAMAAWRRRSSMMMIVSMNHDTSAVPVAVSGYH